MQSYKDKRRLAFLALGFASLCAALMMAAARGASAAPAETVLWSFCSKPSCSDGAGPVAGLISDSAGNLYGTTFGGGGVACVASPGGCGVVFELSPEGNQTVLHAFTGGGDGENPYSGVIADSVGNLYGTTSNPYMSQSGVVFKLSSSGIVSVLHTFTGSPGDGGNPHGGLIADSGGNFYGTTTQGGVGMRRIRMWRGVQDLVGGDRDGATLLYRWQ